MRTVWMLAGTAALLAGIGRANAECVPTATMNQCLVLTDNGTNLPGTYGEPSMTWRFKYANRCDVVIKGVLTHANGTTLTIHGYPGKESSDTCWDRCGKATLRVVCAYTHSAPPPKPTAEHSLGEALKTQKKEAEVKASQDKLRADLDKQKAQVAANAPPAPKKSAGEQQADWGAQKIPDVPKDRERSPLQIECSEKADARGLTGEARKEFRRTCLSEGHDRVPGYDCERRDPDLLICSRPGDTTRSGISAWVKARAIREMSNEACFILEDGRRITILVPGWQSGTWWKNYAKSCLRF